MTYDEARDAAQIKELHFAIDAFVDAYNGLDKPAARRRQTLILFPGGCGSKLKQSRVPFDGTPGPDPSRYREVWLNCYTFVGGALELEMTQVDGRWVEKNGRIVIAGPSVEVLGYTPYDQFACWCDRRGIDVFFYGYDWRRSLDEMGEFFADRFLPEFQRRLIAECGFDPLENLSLLGHCMGGMLVNWILRQHHARMPKLVRAVTVATPFYGYAGQVGRWFAGEPYLNDIRDEAAMVRVISSFPGLYAVNLLEEGIYDRHRTAFGQDDYPLAAYPSVDAGTGFPVDPYNPQEGGARYRYPAQDDTGFSRTELARGKAIAGLLSGAMAAGLSAKFFNLRGVRRKAKTAGGTRWKTIGRRYDPNKERSPIDIAPLVPGDDTQPAWTARLLREDEKERKTHVITVQSNDAEHVFILVSGAVLKRLAGVLDVAPSVAGERRRKAILPPIATPATAKAFVADLKTHFETRRKDGRVVTPADLRRYQEARGFGEGFLKRVARRILIDLLRPVPDGTPVAKKTRKRRRKAVRK